ncbi:MAG: hypothetical protein ACREF3_17950, partial [Acetobacteraceae bacterium]
VCLGAVILFKSAILREVGVNYAIWGIAAIKAMILAKFMLLGRMLHLGKLYGEKPLIWPTLHKSLMFLILLLVLTTLEELAVGWIHSRSLIDSLTHVVGPTFYQGLAVSFIMFLILVPYSAFTSLGDALGEHEMFRLFFVDRSVIVSYPNRQVDAGRSANARR